MSINWLIKFIQGKTMKKDSVHVITEYTPSGDSRVIGVYRSYRGALDALSKFTKHYNDAEYNQYDIDQFNIGQTISEE